MKQILNKLDNHLALLNGYPNLFHPEKYATIQTIEAIKAGHNIEDIVIGLDKAANQWIELLTIKNIILS